MKIRWSIIGALLASFPSMVPINYLAVILAAVVSIILGFLWYGPIFGKPWMRLMGIDPGAMTPDMRRGMGRNYTIMIIGSLLMAFVFDHAIIFAQTYLHASNASSVFQASVWNWLGFIAPVTIGSVLWEKRPWKLWILNSGFYLVSLFLMSCILVAWK